MSKLWIPCVIAFFCMGCSNMQTKGSRVPAGLPNQEMNAAQLWAYQKCGSDVAYKANENDFYSCVAEKMKIYDADSKTPSHSEFVCQVYKNMGETMPLAANLQSKIVNDQAEIKIGKFGNFSYEASYMAGLIHLAVAHKGKHALIAPGHDHASVLAPDYTVVCDLVRGFHD